MKILANDGISQSGINKLMNAGHKVFLQTVPQESLEKFLKEEKVEVILVRSATKVRKNLIDNCPNLKLIGRGGVGLDNIDVEYAKSKGIKVINTPSASSHSVAELVFAHLSSIIRFLHDSNRNMPLEGDKRFKELKKSYKNGSELKGKTIGIIGLGRIGQAVAKIAIGLGMKVKGYDNFLDEITLELIFFDGQKKSFTINSSPLDEVLSSSDFLTIHIPKLNEKPLVNENEFNKMKNGVVLINAARGGIVNEQDLLKALDNNKVSAAGLDVFENEPNPSIKLLMHPKISLSPHTGASTNEAQDRIGDELAEKIISYFS